MLIAEREYLEWKQTEVTQALIKALKKAREGLKEGLIRSNYDNEEFVKGKAQAYQDLIEMNYRELQEMLNDE